MYHARYSEVVFGECMRIVVNVTEHFGRWYNANPFACRRGGILLRESEEEAAA